MSYPNYHMITDRIAIGNFESSYDAFDVIVNLNFPFNGIKQYEIQIDEFILNDKERFLARVGIMDTPNDNQYMYQVLSILTPKLIEIYYQKPSSKFLFHCFAGISRSTTMALSLLSSILNISVEDAYSLAKQKRVIVQPNPGFYDALKHFKNKNF